VPPVTGEGCAGVDWSDVGSLPVARVFDPVTVFDDESIDTPGLVLDEPGCYSFGATVDPLIGDSAGGSRRSGWTPTGPSRPPRCA
jgi:hypothetical protein